MFPLVSDNQSCPIMHVNTLLLMKMGIKGHDDCFFFATVNLKL